jgi:hypothetical protein
MKDKTDSILAAEMSEFCNRLLESEKPKMIVGSFEASDFPLNEEKTKHFETADYLWQQAPQKEGEHEGKCLGVLLDEKLDYVHMVMATQEFIDLVYER